MLRSLVATTAALVLAGCGLDWSVPEGGAGGGGKAGAGGTTGSWHAGNAGGGGEGPGGTKATTTGVTTATTSGVGAAATTSTAASTTGGGGAAPCDSGDTSKCAECEICAQNGECAVALGNCNADGGCPDLFNCYFGCDGDGFCQNNCYVSHSGSVQAFEELAGCLYCAVCIVSCGPTPRCQ